MRDLTTVFTHRGLSPHQFTPMSGAHNPDSLDAAITLLFALVDQWRRASDLGRWHLKAL
jgi:hypothetical protein